MLEDKDIEKLTQVFATKEEIKSMIEPLATKEVFLELQNSVDDYAKKADT